MDNEKYEESLNEFENAQKYIERSLGFQFFSVTQYCIDKATLYKHMGRQEEAEQILEKGKQFCEEKGYVFKAEMISRYRNNMETNQTRWNLSLDGITLKQLESNLKALAVEHSNNRQKHNMEFLSVWQKTVEGYTDTLENLIRTSMKTLKKYFSMDYVFFIRLENEIPVVKYDDSSTGVQNEQINYVANYFKENRMEVITSRIELSYYEHRGLIDNVLGNHRINSVVFAPIYNNDKLDSIFVTYSLLKDSWNSFVSKTVCDKEELPIFMFFFRELLNTIDRLEDKIEICKRAEEVIEMVNNLESDGVVELIDNIKMKWKNLE